MSCHLPNLILKDDGDRNIKSSASTIQGDDLVDFVSVYDASGDACFV